MKNTKETRPKIPKKIETELLLKNDMTCCICKKSREVQVHHIDGDSHNNDLENLAVVCPNCHSKIHKKGRLTKNYTPELVKGYKDQWEREVEKSRQVRTEEVQEKDIEKKRNAILSPISGLCLGRESELSQLKKNLEKKSILLIKGITGIGKTTLGLKFRDILEEKGYHTVWYQCDFESYERFLIFLSDYLKNRGSISFQSLRDQSIPPEERLKTAVQELCIYPTVLFLDNFQNLKNDSDFGIFKEHLRNSTLVVMSRTQPQFLLQSCESLPSLDEGSSVDLLKALDVKESQKVLKKICEKTQGHPWSLVHFAELSRVLPVKNLLEELPDFGREQEAYLSKECWKLLNESEKDFLMRASVFTRPLTFEALKVCSRGGEPSEVLIRLARRFYIVKRDEYYYIHDIMKNFTLSKLKEYSEFYIEAERAASDYYRERLSAESLLLIYFHLRKAGNHGEALDSIIDNIGYFWKEGFWTDVREVLEESLDSFEDEKTRAGIYFSLGTIVHKLGEWDRAIEYYEKSLEISEKLGNVHAIALTYNNLGSVYDDKGDYEKAIEYYGRNLKLEKLGDVRLMAQTYGNLGLEYYRTGDYEKAIEYYERDLEISKELGDVQGMSQTYNNLGLIYADKGEYEKAIEYYEKSLEISKKIEDVHGMAQTYGNLGSVHANKGEYEKAIEYHMDCLSILEKLRDVHGMAQIFGNLGNISFARKEYERALEWYQKALEIFEKIGAKHDLKIVNENLSRTYEKLRK